MSTVKISQLPVFSIISANTANTLFVGVDIPTDTTFQMTATTLAQDLFSNNPLNVGSNPILLSNTIAQFSGSDPLFSQINNQNFNANGSADYIATADIGTNSNNYVDLGINNSQFSPGNQYSSMKPLDGYLYVHGSSDTSSDGNLIIGTASTGANVYFIAGNTTAQNIIMTLTKSGLVLNTQSSIVFADGSKQFTAGASNAYTQAAYAQANSISAYANTQITYLLGIDAYQNTIDQIQTANIAAAFNTANSATSNTIYTQGVDVTQNAATLAINNFANSAYAQANAISSYANSSISYITGVELTQNSATLAVNNYANSAYTAANSAYTTANSAQANTIVTQGVDVTQNTNISLLQGAMTSANANIVTLFANTVYQSGLNATQNTIIQSAYNQANLANSIANTAVQNTANIILPGNVTFNGANTNFNSSIVTFNGANTNFNSNIVTYGTMTTTGNVVTTGNLTATGPVTFNGNFINNGQTTNNGNTINNGNLTTTGNVISIGYLTSNGTSTFNGNTSLNGYVAVANNLTVNNVFTINVSSQLLTMNGIVTIQSSIFAANSAGLRLDGSNSGVAQATTSTGTMLQIVGLDAGYSTRVLLDNYSYGNTNAYPLLAARAARGNSSNPAPVQTNDVLFRLGGQGYGNTYTLLGGASVDMIALENYTDATKGSQINLTTTPVGTNTRYTTVSVNTSVVTVNTNLTVANTIQYNGSLNNAIVTQLTNKSTAVYANGRTGQITTSNALLNKGVAVQFTVYNNYIVSAKDVVIINLASGASVGYNIGINSVSPGSFVVNVHNADGTPSGSNQSDALVLNFAVLRVA